MAALLFDTAAVINAEALPPACPPELKLCGEYDTIIFPDGSEERIEPAAR